MLSEFAFELDFFMKQSQHYMIPWLIALAMLWGFDIFNWMIGSRLNILGIYPRHPFGLIGILFSPLLHQDMNHLLFNTIPLFVLGLALLANSPEIFFWVTIVVAGVGGFAVWLFGRKAMHIGASGLISGYFGYVLVTAYLQPSFTTVLLAGLVLYYFGGIFFGIFPQEEAISWESHLLGFLSGILSAFLPSPLHLYYHFG